MNSKLYRIVLNRQTGQRVVVAETARVLGKGAGSWINVAGVATILSPFLLSPLALCIAVLFGGASIAQAQIVAYRQAPGNQQPTVLQSANGVPLVNIQTPSAQGVSRNVYSQFDVDGRGAILNNSRSGTATHLGGWVQGNPWLGLGTARVIVNEVNSANPSYVRGPLEVAGERAHVIVANPAGLYVGDSTFINASRATLTTGAPVITGGRLDAYRVATGTVTVDGKGVDAMGADYTDIMARAVNINAAIWANNLKVSTGANTISANHAAVNPAGSASAAPGYAIDVSRLGGMYAGQITLVGTEHGVGMRNAGTIGATSADLVVTASGWLENAGRLDAAQNMVINAASLQNQGGKIQAGGNAMLTLGTGGLDNSGRITAAGNLVVNAARMGNQSGQIQAGAATTLALGVGQLDNTRGLIDAGSVTRIAAGDVINADTNAPAGNLGIRGHSVTIDAAAFNNKGGAIRATGELAINAAALDNTDGSVAANRSTLALGNGRLENTRGLIGATTANTIAAGQVINAATLVAAGNLGIQGQSVALTAASLDNHGGAVRANEQVAITSAGAIVNRDGVLSGGQMTLSAGGALDNARGLVASASATTVAAASIDNAGTRNAAGNLGIQGQTVAMTAGALDNQEGAVRAQTALTVAAAQKADNRGGMLTAAQTSLDLGAGRLDNTRGLIGANGATTITAGEVVNADTKTPADDMGIQGQSVTIAATSLDNGAGAIRAGTDMTLDIAGGVNNQRGDLRANSKLALNSAGQLDNREGEISAGQRLQIGDSQIQRGPKTQTVLNSGGTLIAGKQLIVDSAALTGDGKMLSQGDLALKLDRDFFNSGITQAEGDLRIATPGKVINDGKLLAGQALDVSAAVIDNRASGQIIGGTISLRAAESVTNRGLIDGADTFIDSLVINNLGTGRIYGDHVALSGTTLNNAAETVDGVVSAPVIAARDRMDLGVATINNSEHALIYSAGDLATGGALDADRMAIGMGAAINNSSATIGADGDVTLGHQVVNNLNAHLETSTEESAGRRIVRFRVNGSPDMLDGDTVRLVNKGSGQVLAMTDWRQMGDEDNFRLVLPSSRYPFDRYGTAFYKMGYQPASNIAGRDEPPQMIPEIYGYQPRDRVWAIMGVTPPENATLLGGAPAKPGSELCEDTVCRYIPASPQLEAAWQAAHATWQRAYDQQQARYEALNQAITAFASDLEKRMVSEWTIYDGTEKIIRTKVTRSDPGMITAGGNLHVAGTLNNANSQVIAGGDLTGRQVNNIGLTGVQTSTNTGEATYTYIKSHDFSADDRRYDTRPYEGQTIQTSFALDITPTGGAGPQSVHPVKSTMDAVPGSLIVVRTSNPDIFLPDNALYRPGSGRYLIEADPQFAGYRRWLGSDAMLKLLGKDPGTVPRRLGDGFYEQQLVQRQIQKAAGQRYIGNYTNNEAQYQALMNAGVEMARAFNYELGVALSAEQMGRLTSDIVWLVKQTVTMSDGSQQEVLVPQVYLGANRLQVTGTGTLIAGANVQFQTNADILNTGTIAAKNTVVLVGQNIDNLGGRITATDTLLRANTDINNLGGAIDGVNSVTAIAGRDINHRSTTVNTANSTTTGTNINSAAQLLATGAGGVVTQVAGRDLNLDAARVAADTVTLAANRDINIGTVHQKSQEKVVWSDGAGKGKGVGSAAMAAMGEDYKANSAEVSRDDAIGSSITGNNINMIAGRDLVTKATNVVADGAITATAGRDMTIGTETSSASARDQHYREQSGGAFADKTVSTEDASSRIVHQGSTFSGDTVRLAAGGDMRITGSDVVSDRGTRLAALGNIELDAATNTSTSRRDRSETTDGMFSSGAGVTFGSKTEGHSEDAVRKTASGSTVGSVNGDVSIAAGQTYTQIGSNVAAPNGDIDILARQVNILAAQNTVDSTTRERFKQDGLTIAATGAVVSAIQSADQMVEAAGQTKDGRMQALALASAAMNLKKAGDALTAAQAAAQPGGAGSYGVGFSATLGMSESESTTYQSTRTQQGSKVSAGNDVRITATGDPGKSDITLQASEIAAGNTAILKADHDINLLGGQDRDEQHSTRSSASFGLGLAVEYGKGGAAFGITANAAGSRGRSDGTDVAQVASGVTGGQQVILQSGNDTNLVGAVVAADQVDMKVGNNLNIASLQDTSQFDSKDQSIGGSVTVGYGASGSFNASQAKVNGQYASVREQSGIEAGDGGFHIQVGGNTDIKGGKIASTGQAVKDGKNTLDTATLTTSSIDNYSRYNAEAVSLGGSMGDWTGGKFGDSKPSKSAGADTPTGAPGYGHDSGSNSSTTNASISDATITLNDAAQQQKTGQTAEQTIASLDREARTGTDNSNGLGKEWNGEALRQEVQTQAQITQSFGQQAAKEIGDYAGKRRDELRNDAKAAELNGDPGLAAQLNAEARKWDEGGAYRVAAHAALGGLTSGLGGAMGAGASTALMPAIAEQIKGMDLPAPVRQVVETAAAAGIGALAGGTAGAVTAANADVNNRQLHSKEINLIEKLAKDKAREQCGADAQCVRLATIKWADTLERYAKGLVDDNEAAKNLAYEKALSKASMPGSEGARGGLERYMADMQAAAAMLDPYRATFIGGTGETQMYFNATPEQRADSQLNYVLGLQAPAPVIPGMKERDEARLEYFSVQNGSAKPIYPVEEVVLGNAVGTRVAATVARILEASEAKIIANSVSDEVGALAKIKNNATGPDLAGKVPNSVSNSQAVEDLMKGKLPGQQISGPGSPREMPVSSLPSETAEDFALKALGRTPTSAEIAKGEAISIKSKACRGCWIGTNADGTTITYRPAGYSGRDTRPTTATVEINSESNLNNFNLDRRGRPDVIKLKFPQKGRTGVAE